MLSLASRMTRWSDGRRIRRACVLPLVAIVGLLLRSASVATQPSRLRDAAASVESRSPAILSKGGLLHPPAAVLESHRRTPPLTSDALAPTPVSSLRARYEAIALVIGRAAPRTSGVARGYDATAPPRVSV